ncbi:MAG: MBL fold metallo-hydrolase [Nitrospirota bacterium]
MHRAKEGAPKNRKIFGILDGGILLFVFLIVSIVISTSVSGIENAQRALASEYETKQFLTFRSSLQLAELQKQKTKEVRKMLKNITWLGHDTFKIVDEKTIYTDPFQIKKSDTADIILITHEHYDHCSPEDVKKIQGPNTTIVTTADCARKLRGNIKTVKPGDRINVSGVEIEAVPSYNINKPFHPKANGWVGFIFIVQGQRIYIAGDTDYIPEMKNFKVDIALLPVSGTYVMTAEEAVKAALDIKPKLTIPMHYGAIVGSESDAQRFKDMLKGKVDVEILKKQ